MTKHTERDPGVRARGRGRASWGGWWRWGEWRGWGARDWGGDREDRGDRCLFGEGCWPRGGSGGAVDAGRWRRWRRTQFQVIQIALNDQPLRLPMSRRQSNHRTPTAECPPEEVGLLSCLPTNLRLLGTFVRGSTSLCFFNSIAVDRVRGNQSKKYKCCQLPESTPLTKNNNPLKKPIKRQKRCLG